MKFITFALALATAVSALTEVRVGSNTDCDGFEDLKSYQNCGANPVTYDGVISGALVSGNSFGVEFYSNADCTGQDFGPVRGNTICIDLSDKLSFELKCIYITCQKVSCLIVVILFLLMRLIYSSRLDVRRKYSNSAISLVRLGCCQCHTRFPYVPIIVCCVITVILLNLLYMRVSVCARTTG